MKIVVAPGSFKGTMTSLTATNVISQSIVRSRVPASITKVVLADGGEGTIESFIINFGAAIERVVVRQGNLLK